MSAALHFFRYLAGIDRPESQVTAAELARLRHYCQGSRATVEVGCFEGATTRVLAEVTQGPVYTVDPFFSGRLGICWSEGIARLHCRSLANVRFLRGLSPAMASAVNEPVDFIFIDGDHSYEGLAGDWEGWFPRVRAGGVIALHDCLIAANSPAPLGSMRFYKETLLRLPEIELCETEGCLAVFRKR